MGKQKQKKENVKHHSHAMVVEDAKTQKLREERELNQFENDIKELFRSKAIQYGIENILGTSLAHYMDDFAYRMKVIRYCYGLRKNGLFMEFGDTCLLEYEVKDQSQVLRFLLDLLQVAFEMACPQLKDTVRVQLYSFNPVTISVLFGNSEVKIYSKLVRHIFANKRVVEKVYLYKSTVKEYNYGLQPTQRTPMEIGSILLLLQSRIDNLSRIM